MKNRQGGFTLVEIAIVLVIIGLLLGGVLKGQELIDSAKVKNFANDFRNIPIFIYGYQDKFRTLPGDDKSAKAHLGEENVGSGNGNGMIEGAWNTTNKQDESYLFWQHVRRAGLAAGPTNVDDANYVPTNAASGIIGITSGTKSPITNLSGAYIICSQGILGKFAKQLDTTLDDGNTATGALQVMGNQEANQAASVAPKPTTEINDATPYTVCMGV